MKRRTHDPHPLVCPVLRVDLPDIAAVHPGVHHRSQSAKKEMMTVGDLFSGIGGMSLGLERTGGFRTKWFVENDPYCQRVLAKHWPGVKRYGDIREVHGMVPHSRHDELQEREQQTQGTERKALSEFASLHSPELSRPCPFCLSPVDLICGGFPCQPFSVAGKRCGKADDRYLWPEMLRVISEVRPAWVLGENVAGIIPMELDTVLADLETEGYETQAFVIPACSQDAPHRRDRVWIVAHNDSRIGRGNVQPGKPERNISSPSHFNVCQDVADTDTERLQRRGSNSYPQRREGQKQRQVGLCNLQPTGWLPEPDVGRVAHGVPHRVDRLRSLGNAVVPAVVQVIGMAIIEARTRRRK